MLVSINKQDLESNEFSILFFRQRDRTKKVHHFLLLNHRDTCEPAQAYRLSWEQTLQPTLCELVAAQHPQKA